MRILHFPAVMIPLLLVAPLPAQQTPTASSATAPTARVTVSKAQIDAVTVQFASNDPAQLDAAIAQVKAWIPTGSAPSTELAKNWFPAMVKAKRYEDTAQMALDMVLVGPSTSNIRDFLPFRVTALQQLGKKDEALQLAKSIYNACDMKAVDKAIVMVGQAMMEAHPDDASLLRKFRDEQNASRTAATQPSIRPGEGGAPMLKAIKVDPAKYEKLLAKLETSSNLRDLERYGNVLLLADQPEKAEQVFHDLVKKAPDQEKARYADGIVRSLKAVDGNLTRALAEAKITAPAPTGPTIKTDPGLP